MNPTFTFKCKTADDTKSLAEVIGRVLKGGEVLEFHSDLGGGKTTFVKGLAVGMGITEVIQSPTFTLSLLHKAARGLELHHYDFYRLQEPGVLKAELAESLAQPNAVVAIEWGDVVDDILPDQSLKIALKTPEEETRVITFAVPAKLDYIRTALQTYQEQGKIA